MKIGIVGATGAVGQQMMQILVERKFPLTELRLFASSRSQGKMVPFRDQHLGCEVLKAGCFDGLKMVFFDASDGVSQTWVPQALEAGAWVVDHSAAFRMDSDIPLAVPEVNGAEIDRWVRECRQNNQRKLVSGPNCSTVQVVMALKPIMDLWGLKRVTVSTYQSVSGAGAAALQELKDQTRSVLDGVFVEPKILAQPIAFNCIPQIGDVKDDGFTSEEKKLMSETCKILSLPELKISATAIRVPTFNCHGASVLVECVKEPILNQLRLILKQTAGIILLDQADQGQYPMNLNLAGKNEVGVGRIRKDPSAENALSFWVVADNLRKGAALNAIQIGERILIHGIH